MESISAIEDSLDDLERTLTPLFELGLHETAAKLDALQRAKLQVVLPYVVHNLVLSYLKMRDIDPSTHPVASELERMGQYFSKIKNVEAPEKRTLVVDQEAATRFIKHAIREVDSDLAQSARVRLDGAAETSIPISTTATTTTTVTTQTIQTTVADAQPTSAALAKIAERKKSLPADDPSDDDVMIIDDGIIPTSFSKAEGKQKAREGGTISGVGSKKKRKAIDPWTGFDDSLSTNTQLPENTIMPHNTGTSEVQAPSQPVGTTAAANHTKPRKPRHKKKKPPPKDVEVIDVDAE